MTDNNIRWTDFVASLPSFAETDMTGAITTVVKNGVSYQVGFNDTADYLQFGPIPHYFVRDIRQYRPVEGLSGDPGINAGRALVNDAAFAAAAATGKEWTLPAGALYCVSKQIVPTTGFGLKSSGRQPAQLVMLTDSGQFNGSTYVNNLSATRLLFKCQSIDWFTLDNIWVTLNPPTGGYTNNPGVSGQTIARTARVLELQNVKEFYVDLLYNGFRESESNWCAINSCDRRESGYNEIKIRAWDCNPTSDNLAQGQGTVLSMDTERVYSTDSGSPNGIPTGGEFDGQSSWRVKITVEGDNILAQEPWLTGTPGHGGGGGGAHQTDGITLGVDGLTALHFTHGVGFECRVIVEKVDVDGVGEVLDLQKNWCIIKEVVGRRQYDSGLKVIYGASYNEFYSVYIDQSRTRCISLVPANTSAVQGSPVQGNTFHKVVIRRAGSLLTQAQATTNPCVPINIENSGDQSQHCFNNRFLDVDVEGGVCSDGPRLASDWAFYTVPPSADGDGGYGNGGNSIVGVHRNMRLGRNYASGSSVSHLDLDLKELAEGIFGPHTQRTQWVIEEEELTIAAAATTDTAKQFPARTVGFATVKVKTTIPTATTFKSGTAADDDAFDAAVAVGAGNSGKGLLTGLVTFANATAVRITPNLVPGAATGVVLVSFHYLKSITPQSTG